MSNFTKNNKQGGFIEIIVIAIVALILMKYFGVTVSEVMAWGKTFLAWFQGYFKDILK